MGRPLVIFGSWYLADVIEELAQATGWSVAGRVDPDPPDGTSTVSVVRPGTECFVAIGDNRLRGFVSGRLSDNGRTLATIVHPSAVVSPSASIGPGSYIGENVVVRARAVIGPGALLHAGAVVSHHCVVAGYAVLGPNSVIASRTQVGANCLVGTGAAIRPGCTIGNEVTVGAGAAVVSNVTDRSTVLGNPARRSPSAPGPTENQSNWQTNTVW